MDAIRKNQMEMPGSETEDMKNAFGRLISKLDTIKEKIIKIKNRA